MSVSDTAVGAILEIPAELLRDIQKAERYIENLQITSKRAAEAVANHWGNIAVGGLDSFIQKLSDAQNAMKGVGTINVTLNTNAAIQSTEQLSSATQKTSDDVSKAAQTMASSFDGLTKVDISKVLLELETFPKTFQDIENHINNLKNGLKEMTAGSVPAQYQTNQIRAWEELIRVMKLAEDEKNKALSNIVAKQDKVYLDEQKRLLADILDLRKQVNGQKIVVAQGQVTGSSTLEQDKKILSDLIARLYEAKDKLKEYNAEKYKNVSAEGQAKAQVNTLNQENALIKEQMAFRDKLNTAIARGNELTAQTQASKARLGNTDEAIAQRQLNSDYKEMLKVIKEKGEIQAKAAEQGRSLNQQEIALISALDARYKLFESDIQRVASAYTKMSEAAARQFANDKTEQLARNAVMLADAQNKAAEAAQKVADAQAKVAQQQAEKDRNQAESELNRLYTERLRLLKEQEQLNNKALINNAKGLPDLTAKENQLLAEVTARIAAIDGQIKNIGQTYAGLAAKTKHAFALDELRQATALQNQFNKALEAVDTSNTKKLVAEYKKLYAENERIQKSLDAANKLPVGTMTPQAYQIYNNLFAEQSANFARMAQIERQNIQEITDFRRQKDIEYNQQSISAFVQAEAQKTAEAKKQAEQQSNDRIQAYQKFFTTYQGAMAAANRLGTRGGQWEDTYENRARVIKNLEAAIKGLNKADSDYQTKLDYLTDALNRLKKAQKEVNEAMKEQKNVTFTDAQRSLQIANTTKTLRDYERAYKDLKDVISRTSTNDPYFAQLNSQIQQTKKHIDEIKKKMGELQKQTASTSNVMGQLQSRIAAAFSVAAITGFLKKVTDVRAQFELQRVALGAIIQDRDEANKIFTQVQNMALESPFSIMQLERATKQVAAFGFETKKLVPTMKMFADLGAGLGVELERITLVMGHLKARGFLEGTMVRQFTNMGFNVLGELSKYYTELEDRMVSVGEVQDRVKKKMISFGDVEEVLKRVTSAGGMFYDMQKKQSDSIWGMMQRITDATDLMLNEIGQSNEGAIKWILTAVRNMINSWRELKPYITSAVSAMTTYMVVAMGWKVITNLMTGGRIALALFTQGLQAAKAAQQSLNVTMASNPYAAVAAALVSLAVYLYQVITATSKLEEEMSRIGKDMTDSLNESIVTFKRLADTISDSNSTYTERTDAMTELRRVYAEILPQEKMEIAYIQSLRGDYAELTKAIQDYYQQKEYQQKMEAIQGSDEAKKLTTQWEDTLNEMNKDGLFDLKYSKAQIKSWADTLSKEMMSGKLRASVDSLDKRIKEVFNAKDLSSFWNETYGQGDMHDILQAYDKVIKAQGDITIETANAENALKSYEATLKNLDFSQLQTAAKDLEKQRKEIQDTLARGTETVWVQGAQTSVQSKLSDDQLDRYRERLNSVEAQIKAVNEAEGRWISNQFKEEVDKLNKRLEDQVQKFWDARNEMNNLERQGKKNSAEWRKQADAMDAAKKSADEFAETYNTKVNWSLIESSQTTFELRGQLDKLATSAFPAVAKKAAESMNSLIKYLLKGKETTLGWLKSLLEVVPESVRSAIPGFAALLGNVDERLALTQEELKALGEEAKKTSEEADKAKDSFDEIVSNQAKKRVDEYGASISTIDDILKNAEKSASGTAKALRTRASQWESIINSYKNSTDKDVWFKTNNQTRESIELMEKNSKAAKALAQDLDGVKDKQGSKGKDPELELWKNRIKAIEDYYTAREKARKNLSTSEAEPQQRFSFEQLWKDLGLDNLKGLSLDELIAQGFDPKKLQTDLVSSLETLKDLIPDKYEEVRKELERTIAKEKIEIQFKVKAEERERLQKSITDMFDNYELTKELGNLGVNVDLTYMVGGKPTTFDDIKTEYYRMMADFANKSEEEQKIISKMGEDIMKKEYDNRKKQLQNYVKYLTESMGERAQIEIKALQDINKIREDATLDQFSKEQAIMQRRKKMNEELSKMDLDGLKSSDVYISVFKDLERASKEQLQYVLNKLKELQSTFKDLSPAQVKSIASEMKKIEDALADKDSVKNLGANLRDAVKYARERNELLREQTSLQNTIEDSDKALEAAQTELYELELKRKGIQDENTKEWEEANDAVLKQQAYVLGLQAQIKALQEQLKGVTDKIDEGESKWEGFQSGISEVRQGMKTLMDSFDSVFEGLDSMGLVNDAFRDTYESIGDILGGIDTFLAGLESMDISKPFSIITGSIKSIGGIFQSIGGIFGIGDKKKERQIQRLVEKVDTLDKAYQRLEKSIDAAYTFDDYNAGYNQMQQNLEAQKRAYEEMIRLEEAKKKTDDEKIKEYREKLQEIADAQDELRKERIEAMGSTTDYLSEAQSFVDAWLDAYKETGNGLDALSESWEEFIEGLFVKQGAAQIVSARLQKVIQQINDAIESGATDFDLADAVNKAREDWKKEAETIEPLLEQLFGSYGLGSGNGELILSDLQKGIQNITEPQAAAIEAYLNSMRFAVFRHTEQLDTLITTIQAQYGSGAENPVVTELKGIRGVLDNIYSTLRSVVKTQAGKTYFQVG